jgi:hypothetical protein
LDDNHLNEVLTIRYSSSDLNPKNARVVVVLRLQETTNSSAVRALHRCWILLPLLVSVFYVCAPILAETSSDINNNINNNASFYVCAPILAETSSDINNNINNNASSRPVCVSSSAFKRRSCLENLPGI